MLAAHAALLAWKAASGQDDLTTVTKTCWRRPSGIHRGRGFGRTQRRRQATALDIDFRLDGGAYMTLSPVGAVAWRTACLGALPLRDHIRVRARAAATNHPPHGAFRGFAVPQSVFAIERHLDQGGSTAWHRSGGAEAASQLWHRASRWRRVRWCATTSTVGELLDRAQSLSNYQASG